MHRRTGSTRRSSAAAPPAHSDDYWTLSTRPLHALALLLPLVLLYELGSLLYLTDYRAGTVQTIRARNLLDQFMHLFGVAGLLAPGIALVTILLIWHVLRKDRWRVRTTVVAGMIFESALWALPLLVFGSLSRRAAETAAHYGLFAAAGAAGPPVGSGHTWQASATIAIGAGLYEEMLFRLVAIALIHMVVKDLLGGTERLARIAAIVVSAAAFAYYHDFQSASGGIDWTKLAFYFCAGVYFATLYLFRGFGIVVATHAAYDIVVLVFLQNQ